MSTWRQVEIEDEEEKERRKLWPILLFLIFVPLCLLGATQAALIRLIQPTANASMTSEMEGKYEQWAPVQFGPVNPELIGTIHADQLTQVARGDNPSTGTRFDEVSVLPTDSLTEVAEVSPTVTQTTTGTPFDELTPTPTTSATATSTSTATPITPTATTVIVFPPIPPDTPTPTATNTPIPPTAPPPTPLPFTNLIIQKTGTPNPIGIGANVTYTLTAINNGPADAAFVNVRDTLPAGVTFSGATLTQGSCTFAGGVVDCGLGTLLKNQQATITITATVNSGGPHVNTAQIWSNFISELNPANNTVTHTLNTAQSPPIAVDDSAQTTASTLVTINVLANDTDPDGDIVPGSVNVTINPSNGTTNVLASGQIEYTPNAGFPASGQALDQFTYEVCDTQPACDTAIVTVLVGAVPPEIDPNPDGTVYEVLCGTTAYYPLNQPVVVSGGAELAIDLVLYELPWPGPPAAIYMDRVRVEIAIGLAGPWTQIFYWGDGNEDTNTTLSPYVPGAGDVIDVNEWDNYEILSTITPQRLITHPAIGFPTGIGIDVDAVVGTPGSYLWIRLSNPDPQYDGACNAAEPGQIDAIQVIP